MQGPEGWQVQAVPQPSGPRQPWPRGQSAEVAQAAPALVKLGGAATLDGSTGGGPSGRLSLVPGTELPTSHRPRWA